jgi:Ser/Thr protein kinase RdoA (MazF antagonist)
VTTRAFDDLTEVGRQRRLRALAVDALRAYDLEVVRCTFVARAFNTVFRVDTADGARYALRMSPSLRIHADGCEELEAAWVTALRNDVGFPTPGVLATRDGSVVARARDPGVPGERTCVLFEWVPGRRLRDQLGAEPVRTTGALAAITHDHGAGYGSGAPPGALGADRVCYFRTPDQLGELRPIYGSALVEAVGRAQSSLDALWRDPPHRPHLLHGDIQPGNVMVRRRDVILIDFQDLIWGFEVQDAVIAVVALETVGHSELVDAFRTGYESVRPWPEADAETIAAIRAARHLNILNFGLNIRRGGRDEFIARHAEPVVEWMSSKGSG